MAQQGKRVKDLEQYTGDLNRSDLSIPVDGNDFATAKRITGQQLNTVIMGDISSLKNDVATAKTDISLLKPDVATLKTDMASVKPDVATAKTDINTLKADMTTAKTDISTNKTDISTLKPDVATLKTDMATIKPDVATAKTDINTLKADMTTAKSDITTNKTDISTLKPDVSTLKTDMVSVKKDVTTIKTDISNIINDMSEEGFAIADAEGNAAFRIYGNGLSDIRLTQSTLQWIAEQSVGGGGENVLTADYNHFLGYGQSLSEGTNSLPLITTTPFSPKAVRFNHGIRWDEAYNLGYLSIVPHIETTRGGLGETPMAGAAETFLKNNGTEKYILSSNAGQGATAIAGLQKGGGPYNRLITDITNGKRLANEAGKSYRLTAILFTQGEFDYGNGIQYYVGQAIQLRNDIIADVEAITGDNYSNLPFIMYQVSSSNPTANGQYPDTGLAHLYLSENHAGFYCATPVYHLRYAAGWNGFDVWHLANIGSKQLGAYYGQALYDVLKGNGFEPLRPINVSVSGNDVLVKFNKNGLLFEKPINLDVGDWFGVPIPNRGFSVKSGGAELIIGVSIVGSDTVKLSCSSSPAGLKVTYGFNNIWNRNAGELRAGSVGSIDIWGITYPLTQWCVIFEKQI